jgi:hypothetical protein
MATCFGMVMLQDPKDDPVSLAETIGELARAVGEWDYAKSTIIPRIATNYLLRA